MPGAAGPGRVVEPLQRHPLAEGYRLEPVNAYVAPCFQPAASAQLPVKFPRRDRPLYEALDTDPPQLVQARRE